MEEFVGIKQKTYACLIDGYEDDDYDKNKIINKKVKGTKKSVIKRRNVQNSTDSLFNDKIILKSQKRFKSDHHKVYTEKINKIADNN